MPVDTPVMTPDGFRPIGELKVGDLVTGSDGFPTPVLGVHPQGVKPVFRISTQDGASVLACGEHLWRVFTASDVRRNTGGRVLQTQDMIGKLRAAHAHRYQLPMVAPVQMPHRDVPIDAYALGALLAAPAVDTHERVAAHVGGSGAEGATPVASPVATALGDLGLAGTSSDTTFIPETYLNNSVSVRTALLQGLVDSQGQCATASDQLRDDVVHLARSLGGIAHVRDDLGVHLIDIRLPGGPDRPVRFIDSIEPEGEAECVCISVAAADSLYVTQDFLVTHNTLNDAFIILDEAQNTSPEQMKMFLTRLGFDSKIVVTGDVTQVDLPSGTTSGLRIVRDILDGLSDVHFSMLSSADVVRHKLDGDIVDAYARYDAEQAPAARPPGRQAGRGGSSGRR
jgi:phosphate starvation-inducible PhoH-like protein